MSRLKVFKALNAILGGGLLIGYLVFMECEYPPLDPRSVMPAALWLGVPLLAGWTWFALGSLKGHSVKEIAGYLAWGALFVGLGSMGVVAGVNGALDAGPAETHMVRVNHLYKHMSARATVPCSQYRVRLSPWRSGRSAEEVSISYSVYQAARSTPELAVTTKPGVFGFEWIASVEIPAASSAGYAVR